MSGPQAARRKLGLQCLLLGEEAKEDAHECGWKGEAGGVIRGPGLS